MLNQYLEEAVQTKEYVKIINKRNDNCLEALVLEYNDDIVKLLYKGSQKSGSIKIDNIQSISFLDQSKEKEFVNANGYSNEFMDSYLDYYRTCLKFLCTDESGVIREQLFENIFHQVKKDSNNLLYKYLTGNQSNLFDYTHHPSMLLLQKSNLSQRSAIENAMKYKVSVTEGPPGTGKTTTILSMIANFISAGKQVVVVSKNNTAVDNIIDEFKSIHLPEFYIRFGNGNIMKNLYPEIDNKIQSIKDNYLHEDINTNFYDRLVKIKNELNEIESQMNEFIKLKSILRELQNQSRFIKRRNEVYDVESFLTDQQKRVISNKNATFKTIDRLIQLSRKNSYTFFEKLFVKFRYHLHWDTLSESITSIKCLLEEIYINKEILKKENMLLEARLDEQREKIDSLYEEYNRISNIIFKNSIGKFISKRDSILKKNSSCIAKAKNIFPLILTTADAFLYNFSDFIDSGRKIDCLIIDETTQCDVLTGLPLLFLAKKIVVVGDSKQLSAITNLDEMSQYQILDAYKYENNNFLKSIKQVFAPEAQMLLEHYRCDYNIINFCNKYYYDNQLIIYTQNNYDSMRIMDVDSYKGAEQKNGSIINEREIKSIREFVTDSEKSFFITPFRMQAVNLRKFYDDDLCGTIHTFQGKGADDVYLSTVLNDLSFCLKHIKEKQNLFTKELINVAVSRAKKKFVLVTDKKFFLSNRVLVPDMVHLIEYITVYGNQIHDSSVCVFDDLYKKMNSYNKVDNLDNIFEQKLFYDIRSILDNYPNFVCYSKLPLVDLVQNKAFLESNPEIKTYILNGAHADFTIVDTRINKPVLVIELDGKYHQYEVQKQRDFYKKLALDSVNIPLLRIPSKSAIDMFELRNMILKYIVI